jgi:hypothetical protein
MKSTFPAALAGNFIDPICGSICRSIWKPIQAYLAALAARKGIQLSDLANDLLKKDIAILEAGK